MLTLLLLTWLQAAPAQPAPTPPKPAASTPAKPQPARRAAAPATTTLTLTVTDSVGAVLEGVMVSVVGADREGMTTAEGRLRLLNVPAGTHRVRFAREGYHTFEKELVWRAGQPAPGMTVTLNAAPAPETPPPPPPAPEPAEPAPPALPPPSAPKTMALPEYIEKNFIGNRDDHKEDLVGCSGVGQAMVWQVREPWADRQHPSADAMIYVIGGDGMLRLDGRDVSLRAGSFAVVPRGTSYGLSRRGRNPLIVLGFLAGAPCAGE